MLIKGLMEGIPENIPDLEEPWPICLLTKRTKIPIVPTTDVSKFAHRFMFQMYFAFFNVEIIRGFTSTFVAIYSATSLPFGFPSRRKRPPLEILKFILTLLINRDNKVAFIWVHEDGSLSRSSDFIKTCHHMNIIFQTTDGNSSYLNGKVKVLIRHLLIPQ